MPLLRRIVDLLPAGVINWAGRLQYRMPVLRPLIQRAARSVREGPAVLRHGVGKGLLFDPCGGNPGYATGTSGLDEQAFLARTLHPGACVYDVGANKGFYVVIAARLVGPTGHVVAVEPFPESAAAVRRNVALNGFENVEVVEAAASDATTRAALVMAGESVEFKLVTSRNWHAEARPGVETIPVDVYALDDLIARRGLRPPDVVLMDIEGAEVEALLGMRETIARHRPVILCEVHWIHRRFHQLVEDVFRPLGYHAATLDGAPLPTSPARYHAVLTPPSRRSS